MTSSFQQPGASPYHLSGSDAGRVREWNQSEPDRSLRIDETTHKRNQRVFWSIADDSEIRRLRSVYKRYGYLLDPHTAVGLCVYDKYTAQQVTQPEQIVAYSSPFKFNASVARPSWGKTREGKDEFKLLRPCPLQQPGDTRRTQGSETQSRAAREVTPKNSMRNPFKLLSPQ